MALHSGSVSGWGAESDQLLRASSGDAGRDIKSAMSGEDPDIIHEAADEVLVLRDLMGLDEETLPADLGRGDLDLELVLFIRLGSKLKHSPISLP